MTRFAPYGCGRGVAIHRSRDLGLSHNAAGEGGRRPMRGAIATVALSDALGRERRRLQGLVLLVEPDGDDRFVGHAEPPDEALRYVVRSETAEQLGERLREIVDEEEGDGEAGGAETSGTA